MKPVKLLSTNLNTTCTAITYRFKPTKTVKKKKKKK